MDLCVKKHFNLCSVVELCGCITESPSRANPNALIPHLGSPGPYLLIYPWANLLKLFLGFLLYG